MMRRFLSLTLSIALVSAMAGAQAPQDAPPPPPSAAGPVILDWTPPSFAQLSTEALSRSSFSLDRDLLNLAAATMSDADPQTKQAINKITGVSVHLLRFGAAGIPDEAAVNAMREAYHLRGWKRMVTTAKSGSSVHTGSTDVWMVLDGMNMKGAVVLAETPRSVTLVTVAGNLSPIDLLHLRGHFGIPNFSAESLDSATR